MILAQVTGADTVVDVASRHSWEAAAVAMVLVAMLVGIGYMMRVFWQINQRLADRVTTLESTIESRLIAVVESTSTALTANTQMMEKVSVSVDKLETAVEHSMHTQQAMLTRMESSPCLLTSSLSEETKRRLAEARRVMESGIIKGD